MIQTAKDVLEGNWTGRSTVPAAGLYPHQWSWDSAFIAIGYAHYKQQRAQQEVISLFRGQWRNGMLPNTVFNPDAPGDYFPGPEYWRTDRSADAPEDVQTSGVIQPPMHAIAVRHIHEHAGDQSAAEAFLWEMYPKLTAWHDYLYRERDANGDGLTYIRHPWESGRDNSPVWDAIFQRMDLPQEDLPPYHRRDLEHADPDERPSNRTYDFFIYLTEIFKRCDYDERRIRERCPFLVQDVLFNTVLCQAEQDLAEIAEVIGEDGAKHRQRAARTAEAMRSTLWDDHNAIYLSYDLAAGERIGQHVAEGFSPLYAGVPTIEQADRLHDYMSGAAFCVAHEDCHAIPSYNREGPKYSPSNYWRGPVWININWLLARGLRRYRFADSEGIAQAIIKLSQRAGFREHYDADTGKGGGADRFSWSAALTLDVIYEDMED